MIVWRGRPRPRKVSVIETDVGTAALGCPAERSSATSMQRKSLDAKPRLINVPYRRGVPRLPPCPHRQDRPRLHGKTYFASIASGSIITNFPIDPLLRNLMRPVILAKRVSSLPRPTFSPGFTRVPRCRTMIVPPGTSCPPKALKPSRCAFESRPFREVPCPFLCAINQSPLLGGQLPVIPKQKPQKCHPEQSQAESEAIGLAESKDPYSSSPCV